MIWRQPMAPHDLPGVRSAAWAEEAGPLFQCGLWFHAFPMMLEKVWQLSTIISTMIYSGCVAYIAFAALSLYYYYLLLLLLLFVWHFLIIIHHSSLISFLCNELP